jgi:hypothetical protein
MLLTIACSISFQRVPQKTIESNAQTAVDNSNTTWLAPFNVSPPNSRTTGNNKPTNTATGINESKGDGLFFDKFPISIVLIGYKNKKKL